MRILRSFALAIACLLLLAGPILAQTPTAGAGRWYAPGIALKFRFGGATPTWAQNASRSAATDFSSASWNNSRTPTFSYGASAVATITYSASILSPCGTGNNQWLQCSANWGQPDFHIYIRNLVAAPRSNWTWCDISFAGTCWDAERALLHEMEHVVMGVANHDPQGNDNTIMGATAPWYPTATWNLHHIQRCDEAAAQLLYGVASPSGQFADCLRGLARGAQTNLIPIMRPSVTSMNLCNFQQAVLKGRFAIANLAAYGSLADSPLAGRTIWIDRREYTSPVWLRNFASMTATAAASVNWTLAISGPPSGTVTYVFGLRASAETGVEASTGSSVTVTWRMC